MFSVKQLLGTHQPRGSGYQQEPLDSYAQNSVAPKLRLPAGGPTRLPGEPDVEDVTDPRASDSDGSCWDVQRGRFIKRKVLRWVLVPPGSGSLLLQFRLSTVKKVSQQEHRDVK